MNHGISHYTTISYFGKIVRQVGGLRFVIFVAEGVAGGFSGVFVLPIGSGLQGKSMCTNRRLEISHECSEIQINPKTVKLNPKIKS